MSTKSTVQSGSDHLVKAVACRRPKRPTTARWRPAQASASHGTSLVIIRRLILTHESLGNGVGILHRGHRLLRSVISPNQATPWELAAS
jgi:hypothetical protein